MSVAIVGGAAIGVAGTIYSANKASKSAKRAGKRADAAEERRLAFEQERIDEWEATYGTVEDQLANYYETLSPTLRITQGLEAFEKEKERGMKQLNETLAQRGIDRSGMAAQIETQVAVDSAEERARIRAAAPMEVAKEKLGFLNTGIARDPYNNMSQALQGQELTRTNEHWMAAQNAGEASSALVGSITDLAGAGLNKYAEYRATKKANTTGEPI